MLVPSPSPAARANAINSAKIGIKYHIQPETSESFKSKHHSKWYLQLNKEDQCAQDRSTTSDNLSVCYHDHEKLIVDDPPSHREARENQTCLISKTAWPGAMRRWLSAGSGCGDSILCTAGELEPKFKGVDPRIRGKLARKLRLVQIPEAQSLQTC